MAWRRLVMVSFVLAIFLAGKVLASGPELWRAAERLYADDKGAAYLVPGSLHATEAMGHAIVFVDLNYRLPQKVSFTADLDFDCSSNMVKMQVKDLYLDGLLTAEWPIWIRIFAPAKAIHWSGESKKAGRIRDRLCDRLGFSRS